MLKVFLKMTKMLKPKRILQNNHQDSKWCTQNIIISTAQQGLGIVNFQITFRLISIAQWVTLNDWGFSLITVTQSWLQGSEIAVKKRRSNCRIHLTKGECNWCMHGSIAIEWMNYWLKLIHFMVEIFKCLLVNTERLNTVV